MSASPITSDGTNVGYSAEDYALAKQIKATYDHTKNKAVKVWKDPKKRIPIEAEMVLQTINILKALPIPQLKLIIIAFLIVLAIVVLLNKLVFVS